MKTKKNIILAIALLVFGIVLSMGLHNLGVTEWSLLILFMLLGLCVGIFHVVAIVRHQQGRINKNARKLRILLSLFALFVVKGMLTGSIPSHLESVIGISLAVQVLFSISGLFFGRAITNWMLDKPAVGEVS